MFYRYLELSCVAREIDHSKEAEGQLQRVTEGPEYGMPARIGARYDNRGVTPATPGNNSAGYGSSRPGTSMTLESRHGYRSSKSRQNLSSAASSAAGSILGVSGSIDDEMNYPPTRGSMRSGGSNGSLKSRGSSDGDETSGMSFPAMDSVWSKDGPENNGSKEQHNLRNNWG